MPQTEGFLLPGDALNAPDGIAANLLVQDTDNANSLVATVPFSVVQQRFTIDLDAAAVASWPVNARFQIEVGTGVEKIVKTVSKDGVQQWVRRSSVSTAVFTPADGTDIAVSSQMFTATGLGGLKWGFSIFTNPDFTTGQIYNSGTLVDESVDITVAQSDYTTTPVDNQQLYIKKAVGNGVDTPQNYFSTHSADVPAGPAGSIDWPVMSSMPATIDINAINNAGESTQFTYGGKTITVAHAFSGNRLPYSRRHGITPKGHPAAGVAIVKDTNSLCYRSDTGASIGGAGFASNSRCSTQRAGIVYGFNGQTLQEHSFISGSKTNLKDLSGQLSGTLKFGKGEGNFSQNEKFAIIDNGSTFAALTLPGGAVTTRSAGNITGADANAVYGESAGGIDWVGTSMAGDKIIAHLTGMSGNASQRMIIYDNNWTNPRKVGDPVIRAQHATFFRGSNNEDCIALYHWDGIMVVDLDDPETVYKIPTAILVTHLNGSLSIQNPGWITYTTKGPDCLVSLVKFDKADFAGAPNETDDFTYIGNHVHPTTTPDQRMVGRFPPAIDNTGAPTAYPDTAMPQPVLDGSAVFVSCGSDANRFVAKVTVA